MTKSNDLVSKTQKQAMKPNKQASQAVALR